MIKLLIKLLMVLTFLTLLASCASLKWENYDFTGDKTLYETDFSLDDGKFRLPPTAEIKDGVLHVDGRKEADGVNFLIPYGNNSITSFKLKLSKEKPEAFFNMLTGNQNGHSRHAVIFRNNNRHFFTSVNGREVYNNHIQGKGLNAETWYQIDIILQDYEYKLFVNGSLNHTINLSRTLSPAGGVNFEYHSEFWVDDFSVREIDSYSIKED